MQDPVATTGQEQAIDRILECDPQATIEKWCNPEWPSTSIPKIPNTSIETFANRNFH